MHRPKFRQKRFPYFFHGAFLLHRLYGVDALRIATGAKVHLKLAELCFVC